jgi:hypothetical protein
MSRVRYILNHIRLTPDYYTEIEGGIWWPWPSCSVPFDVGWLNKRSLTSDYVHMHTLQVHALAFGEPAAGVGNFLRWDCINGWNLTQAESI